MPLKMVAYIVAAPDQYLAITGMGITNVKICKSSWVWPFQRCMRFSVQPHDYAMNLQAMTKEVYTSHSSHMKRRP